jgi:hypothetical protein
MHAHSNGIPIVDQINHVKEDGAQERLAAAKLGLKIGPPRWIA